MTRSRPGIARVRYHRRTPTWGTYRDEARTMAELKLTYFDFDGGRGEPVRLALNMAGIPFEDERIPGAQWAQHKDRMPLRAMPVLTVDGHALTQCNTINRYVGKLAGLYPEDPWQAVLCDEVMDAVEDVSSRVFSTMAIADEDQKRAAREALTDDALKVHLVRLAAYLAERGGEYFADGRLTMADLKVFLFVRHLRSGILDYIPADLVDRVAPSLVAHFERVRDHAGISTYYESRRRAT